MAWFSLAQPVSHDPVRVLLLMSIVQGERFINAYHNISNIILLISKQGVDHMPAVLLVAHHDSPVASPGEWWPCTHKTMSDRDTSCSFDHTKEAGWAAKDACRCGCCNMQLQICIYVPTPVPNRHTVAE
jgi:hypothetical protein